MGNVARQPELAEAGGRNTFLLLHQLRFDLLPTMERQRLRALLQRFGQLLRDHALLSQVLGYL